MVQHQAGILHAAGLGAGRRVGHAQAVVDEEAVGGAVATGMFADEPAVAVGAQVEQFAVGQFQPDRRGIRRPQREARAAAWQRLRSGLAPGGHRAMAPAWRAARRSRFEYRCA
ncbi:hypothetical protein D3C76_993940 [compost metagenome]